MSSQINTTAAGISWEGVIFIYTTVPTMDMDGGIIYCDEDGDSYLDFQTDDTLKVYINGALDFQITANAITAETNSAFLGQGSVVYDGAPIAAQQVLAGPGAITLTELHTLFESTGAGDALTLADGTAIGQKKIITHYVDGGSGVLTPTNLAGGTTITFTTVGEIAELVWDGSNWRAEKLWNSVTPGTIPVLA